MSVQFDSDKYSRVLCDAPNEPAGVDTKQISVVGWWRADIRIVSS